MKMERRNDATPTRLWASARQGQDTGELVLTPNSARLTPGETATLSRDRLVSLPLVE